VIQLAAKALLGPMLYVQAWRLRRTALELPEPHGERLGVEGAGPGALRVLVAGDSSAAGVGARTQDEALAIPLARNLSRRLGAAVGWQLVAESGRTSATLLDLLRESHLERADMAVVVVGVNDVTREVKVAEAMRNRSAIAALLRERTGARHIAFAAVPRMEVMPVVPNPLAWYIGQSSRRINRAQKQWAQTQADCAHVEFNDLEPGLFCEDGFHPGPLLYARLAEELAEHLLAHVDAPDGHLSMEKA